MRYDNHPNFIPGGRQNSPEYLPEDLAGRQDGYLPAGNDGTHYKDVLDHINPYQNQGRI